MYTFIDRVLVVVFGGPPHPRDHSFQTRCSYLFNIEHVSSAVSAPRISPRFAPAILTHVAVLFYVISA